MLVFSRFRRDIITISTFCCESFFKFLLRWPFFVNGTAVDLKVYGWEGAISTRADWLEVTFSLIWHLFLIYKLVLVRSGGGMLFTRKKRDVNVLLIKPYALSDPQPRHYHPRRSPLSEHVVFQQRQKQFDERADPLLFFDFSNWQNDSSNDFTTQENFV